MRDLDMKRPSRSVNMPRRIYSRRDRRRRGERLNLAILIFGFMVIGLFVVIRDWHHGLTPPDHLPVTHRPR